MALVRVTPSQLNVKLKQLKALINVKNQKELTVIFSALGRPEFLNSKYVEKRIQQRIQEVPLSKVLHEINDLLMDTYKDDATLFVSGNSDYDQIISFTELIADYCNANSDHEIITQIDGQQTEAFEKYFDPAMEIKNNNIKTYEQTKEAYEALDSASKKLDFKQLNALLDKVSPSYPHKQKTFNYLLDSYAHALAEKYDVLLGLSLYIRTNRDYLSEIKLCISHAATEIYLLQHSQFQKLKIFQTMYEYIKMRFNEARYTTHKFEIDSLSRTFEHEITYSFAAAAPFKSHVLHEDKWMMCWMSTDKKSTSDELLVQLSFQLNICEFSRAIKLFKQESATKGRTARADIVYEDLYAAFSLLPLALGPWKSDEDSLREFNWLMFTYEQLQKLKTFSLIDDKEEFNLLLENAINALLRAANNDNELNEIIELPSIKPLSPERKKYYDSVCKQQYWVLAAELLVQCRRFNIAEFSLPETDYLIKKYFSEQQYTKYSNSYGIDGLFDFVLDKISEMDKVLDAYPPIKKIISRKDNTAAAKPVSNAEEIAVSEANFEKLLVEINKEKAKIKTIIKAKVNPTKLATNKHSTKKTSAFFKDSQNKSQAMTTTAKKYYAAGRIRNLANGIETSLPLYQEIVATYLDTKMGAENDFFYIAASLAELADCYFQQALLTTPDDFSISLSNIFSTVKLHNKAVEYANHANDCFLIHISPLAEQYSLSNQLDQFEQLAQHINEILSSTTAELKSINEQYAALIKNLKTELTLRADERMRAIEAFGGIEKWVRNSNPKNSYKNVRDAKVTELKNLKSAASAMQNIIDNKIKPLKDNFSYLCGVSALPLLAQSPPEDDEKSTYAEDKVLQGKGIFQQRLHYLSHSSRLLKDCQKELVLPLLLATINESISVSQIISKSNVQLSSGKM